MSDIEKLPLSTPDIKTGQIEKLRQLFPEVFTEGGKLDFDRLRATLGDLVDDGPERFGLTWPGKRDCFRLIQEPSTGTLLPVEEESVNWDTTQNLFIEADNLEALKLLQKSYYGKVKMIYIDPPYNTGKDFIYPDRYAENLQTYLAYTGQASDEGYRFSTNPDTDGRFHSRWLNMMYPRLFLARNLLRDDGVIFISIDDSEVDNLKKVLNEIFGEENALATLVIDKNRKNDARFFSVGHEYMLVYSRNKQFFIENDIWFREPKQGIDEVKIFYKSLRRKYKDDFDKIQEEWRNYFKKLPEKSKIRKLGRYSKVSSRGPYRDDGNISWPGGNGPKYEVLHPVTKKACKIPDGGWRYSKPEKFWDEVKKGKVGFGPDETTLPRQVRYLFEGDGQVMRSVSYSYAQTATLDFNELMGQRIFENPKYWDDIRRIIKYVCSDDDIILDFFSGSCTTAHAVFYLNKKEGSNRRFVLVQLPEPTDETSEAAKAGYATIADIGKERIRRVIGRIEAEAVDLEQKISSTHTTLEALAKEAAALKADQPKELFGEAKPGKELTKILEKQEKAQEELEQAQEQLENIRQCDLGFRVFRLGESNFKVWDGDLEKEDLGKQLEMALEYIRPERSEQDMLFELLIKSGFPLTTPVERLTLAGKTVWSVAEGSMLVCLERPLTQEVIRAMAAKEPPRVVVLDAGFQDNDPLKTNAVQIMRSHGVEDFRTV